MIFAMTFMILLPQKVNAEVKEVRPVKSVSGGAVSIGSTWDTSISQTSATVYVGEVFKLNVYGTIEYTKWKSDNKDVATVSKKGRVTGLKPGVVNITATVKTESGNTKLICQVTVKSRLSSSVRNIVCTEDDYQDITFYCENLGDNEHLYYYLNDEDIISIEYTKNGALRIIPEKNGVTSIIVHVGKSENNYNENDFLKVNVFIVNDANWIPLSYLQGTVFDENYYLDAEYDHDAYIIDYNDYEISFKFDGMDTLLYVDDLREAGLL